MKKQFIALRYLSMTALLMLSLSFSNKVNAQSTYDVSVSISYDLFMDAVDGSAILIEQTGDYSYNAVRAGNPNYPVYTPCKNQMTQALANSLKAAANACCCPVRYCAQGADCGWYFYIFYPSSSAGCGNVDPYYMSTITAQFQEQ